MIRLESIFETAVRVFTSNVEETRKLGSWIGESAFPGMVVLLTGELGSGKTCLVQGMAQGLEVPEDCDVVSPSYTLVHEYPGRLMLVHMDLYRIGPVDLDDIGLDDILAGSHVVAVEWGDKLPDPGENVLQVEMVCLPDDTRRIIIQGTGNCRGIPERIRKCGEMGSRPDIRSNR